ncbi:TPA: hypothetical protein DEO28_01410 [Candidatus Dependentiae bacterium]|nr:MAG: hypothetical protein UR14_C0003G0130 [candidate division TM6 bacterium GW2011_GWE2_31_21]KKP53706.1 MAG: hypothetical protein UR43_C0003G0027 [candidate division TM6 bacterium GW2011_GWF2_33_332]HBS48542.1 hypothetical protein [Candidatus Dependentiae bacterium]HBZ73157.1 hypothetical protein [Candidatus Dependentiae bacterium]
MFKKILLFLLLAFTFLNASKYEATLCLLIKENKIQELNFFFTNSPEDFDINEPLTNHRPYLLYAASLGNLDILKLLLDHEANIEETDKQGHYIFDVMLNAKINKYNYIRIATEYLEIFEMTFEFLQNKYKHNRSNLLNISSILFDRIISKIEKTFNLNNHFLALQFHRIKKDQIKINRLSLTPTIQISFLELIDEQYIKILELLTTISAKRKI